MHRSLRQFPDQPGLNRSEKEFPTFRLFSCTLYIVQNPFYFGRRKIGIDHETCLLTEFLCESLFLEGVAVLGSSAALPDDCMINGISGILIPYNCRFSLIGNSDRRNIRSLRTDHIHGFHRYAKHTRPDFIRIMLHPARLRKVLMELALCYTAHFTFFIKQDAPVAGCPRVQCHYVFLHR